MLRIKKILLQNKSFTRKLMNFDKNGFKRKAESVFFADAKEKR